MRSVPKDVAARALGRPIGRRLGDVGTRRGNGLCPVRMS